MIRWLIVLYKGHHHVFSLFAVHESGQGRALESAYRSGRFQDEGQVNANFPTFHRYFCPHRVE